MDDPTPRHIKAGKRDALIEAPVPSGGLFFFEPADHSASFLCRSLSQSFSDGNPRLPQDVRNLSWLEPRGIVFKAKDLAGSIHVEFPQSVRIGKFRQVL